MRHWLQRDLAHLPVVRCFVIPLLFVLTISGCAFGTASSVSEFDSRTQLESDLEKQQSLIREMVDWQLLKRGNPQEGDWSVPLEPFEPLKPEGKPERKLPTEAAISTQLVSAPVEQVLHTLARSAKVKLQLNQAIPGTVTLLAENQSLDALLQQVSMQVPIAWEVSDNVLQLWGDKAYTETYPVDYLNMDRSTRSRVGLATQVGTINANDSDAGSGVSNSSQTLLENKADHFFWASLNTDLQGLISQAGAKKSASYTLNRDAGLVTLHASRAQHVKLENYLVKLNRNAQRQVLIEATVVEVALSKNFEAGIDWQFISQGASGVSAAQVLSGAPQVSAGTVDRIAAPNGLLTLVQPSKYGTLSGTLNLLDRFGDVRILSKPRIIALNNQTSVLKVVDNRVYFTVNVERQRSETKDEVITETEIHTVPVGLVMNVTPHINDASDVMLNVRPTLSRIIGFVDDPNPELASADVRNSVPEIQVREMESMLRVKSGDIAIIGGLMQDVQNGGNRSLPGLASIPFVGSLFQQRNQSREQTELLIVLKPTVLPVENASAKLHN